jgi:hypothetical protein
MAQTGALIVERLFWFVSLTRLVFSTLITNDVCSLGLGVPYRKRLYSCDFLPFQLCPISFCVFRARFLVCPPFCVLAGRWFKPVVSTVGIPVQVRVLSSVSYFHTDD